MARIVAYPPGLCHPAGRDAVVAPHDHRVDAVRLRQLRVRLDCALHRLSRVLRELSRRQRDRPRRFPVGSGHLDRHGHRRAHLAPARRHRRPRRGAQALLRRLHGRLRRRDGSDGDGTAGDGPVGLGAGGSGRRHLRGGIIYYNSYLPRIAPPEQLGRVSAAGFAVGYAGGIVAFLAAYPFAVVDAFWGCFLSAAALFAVMSLPSFIVLPADQRHPMPMGVAAARGAQLMLATLREILTAPERVHMRRFLGSYLIYEDGVNTVVTFAGVFAAKTLGFSFKEIILLFMLVQITALVGSALWARPTDSSGPRFVVRVTLVQWALVTVLAFFVQEKWHFWIVAILAGTGLGAVQAASRTFMATLVPPEREAEFFGFYALVGKTGAVLGPVVFGLVSWLLSGNQRAAIVAVGLFFVVGFLLLGRV